MRDAEYAMHLAYVWHPDNVRRFLRRQYESLREKMEKEHRFSKWCPKCQERKLAAEKDGHDLWTECDDCLSLEF
jgi:ribosomal protein L37AE/L43A